jgi:hypothetical protein
MNLEEELLKSTDKDELEVQIKQKINSFHGFLTREVALRLIAKEKGLLKEKEKVFKLAEIPKEAKKISFKGSVKKVWPIASYSSGKKSRVVEVQDDSGSLPLILWNNDIKLARGLRSRDKISVKGAYEKNSELHLGFSGKFDIVKKAPFIPLNELHDGEMVHVRGKISKIEGVDSFVHGIHTSRAFSFMIKDDTNEARVVMWEDIARGEGLKEGDEVVIEDGLVNKGNIDLSSDARILTRRDMLIGEVTKFECQDNELLVSVGGKELKLDRKSALRLMGVAVADDILLSTVATLKKDSLLNNRITLRIEERNGQIFIKG